jgi:hypothetical protein
VSDERTRTRRTFKEKQNWVLDRFDRKWQRVLRTIVSGHYAPSISASDEEDEEAWHKEFGGYRRYYTMGGNVSPDFARTLRAMYENGILYRGTAGNQGARDGGYAQKTYYVFYTFKQHYHEAARMRRAAGIEPDDGYDVSGDDL